MADACDAGLSCEADVCVAAMGSTGASGDPRTIFVTSSIIAGGLLGGVGQADVICSMRATEAGLLGSYVAILASETASLDDRIEGEGPVFDVGGTMIAADRAALLSGTAENPVNVTETGTVLEAAERVWVGSAIANCDSWTAVGELGLVGSPTDPAAWLDDATRICSSSFRLYCLSR